MIALFVCVLLLSENTIVNANDIAHSVPAPENATVTTTANSLLERCETDGYKYHTKSGGCYKLHQDSTSSWEQAKLSCETEGGYLAIINDADEARMFKSFFRTDKGSKWVGLFKEAGVWRSVRGDRLVDVFHRFQRRVTLYDCAVFTQLSHLGDFRCSEKRNFICEKQI